MKSTTTKPWTIVTILCATATAGYICCVNVSTAAPLLRQEFGLLQIEMGRIFSAFLLGYALFQIPSGVVADRFGARRVLLWITWFWFIITVIQTLVGSFFSLAASLVLFIIFRFILGVAASPTYPGSAQGVSRWILPEYQERNFGLLSGAWMSSLPWILSIISIPLGGLISDRLVSGRLGIKWGRRIVPITGMALSGLLISIGAHTGNAVIAAISLAFATAFILCVEGPFWAMMMRIAGDRSGTAGGIMNMGSNLGGLLSPALTPVIASIIGWENALHVAAALSVTGALLWLGIKPPIPIEASLGAGLKGLI